MALPLTDKQAVKALNWLKQNFSTQIIEATKNTPFVPDVVYGIACQETACVWLQWIDKVTPDIVIDRCVFDASGDVKGTTRKAFPQNKAAFVAKYGEAFAQDLIHEANLTRALRNMQPADLLYKGYGIFQYDLQNIVGDEKFFREKLWYSFDECLQRCIKELLIKYHRTQNVWGAVKAYNGAGLAADLYCENVKHFSSLV